MDDDVKARRAKVLKWRQSGRTFKEIAAELRVSSSRASQIYYKSLDDLDLPNPATPLTVGMPVANLPISRRARATLTDYATPLAELVGRDPGVLRSELLRLNHCDRRVLYEIEAILEKLRSEE